MITEDTAKPEISGKPHRSAFIALIGRPNSGKSTLMNAILGEELAVVTSLPQTTRKNLRGIYTADGVQLVFVDTPGMHHGTHSFNKSMVHEGVQLLKRRDVDIICYLIDCSRTSGNEEDSIARSIADAGLPVLLVFNKKDLCEKPEEVVAAFQARYQALSKCNVVVLAASMSDAKETFLNAIMPMVPEGPQYFPGDDLSDADMRFFAAEYIRKHIITNTQDEVPHAVFVEVHSYRETESRHYVEADLHVETDGQKAIVIGKKGTLIRKIQQDAAVDIEKLTGVPVSVVAHVKITPKWRDNERFLHDMGFFVK
jgi:GTP-binding protein Era